MSISIGPIQHAGGRGAGQCDCWCARCDGPVLTLDEAGVERLAAALLPFTPIPFAVHGKDVGRYMKRRARAIIERLRRA